jgi:hypothetical protein
MSENNKDLYPLHLLLLLGGGLCLGTGILMLYDSFGWHGGDLNSNFAAIGFSGLDNISLLDRSEIAIPLVTIGALALIFANATAWRETDGY